MRSSIPITALVCLLLNGKEVVNSAPLMFDSVDISIDTDNNNNGRESESKKVNIDFDVDVDINTNTNTNKNARNYVCNEPFMIPAEYVDSTGNVFAMCLSDPRFHRRHIIWYIQDLIGSDYKALGVAVNRGGDEFVGTVVPIQQPGFESGMHADPVAVRVRLDRSAGVVSVKPVKNNRNSGGGKLVNWMIKPNGFAPGSLRIPDSCGPFLKTLAKPRLLNPLTGAEGNDSTVCVLHGSKVDAFISWGSFKHENENKNKNEFDALAIDGGFDPKFFSVGFVGADRGVSIDICDRSGGEAVRCEMSRLVGNTRKTFIVGDVKNVPKVKEVKKHKEVKEVKKHKAKKDKKHKQVKKHKLKKHKATHSCDIKQTDSSHDDSSLVKKIDTIKHDIRSILARAQVHSDDDDEVKPVKRCKRHSEPAADSCNIDPQPVTRKCPVPVKKHRVKTCKVKHPLLRPPPPTQKSVKTCANNESKLLTSRFNRLNRRLENLEEDLYSIETAIVQRYKNFAKWIRSQKTQMEQRAKNFVDYLEGLKYNVVYTPKDKKVKRKFIAGFGKTIRKSSKLAADAIKQPVRAVNHDLVNPMVGTAKGNVVNPMVNTVKDDVVRPVNNNLFDPLVNTVGSTAKTVNNNVLNPVVNTVDNVVVDPIDNNFIRPVAKTMDNTLIRPIDNNLIRPLTNTADKNLISPLTNTVDNNLIRPVTNSAVESCSINPASRYDRFDYNDDLRPRSQLATSPGIEQAAANPLGPGGPVLPPPAVKTFKSPEDPSVLAAIDYLT